MVRIGVVGLGKMGLSHYAMLRANPDVEVVAVCDSFSYLLGILNKYTGVKTYTDHSRMLQKEDLDAVVISTPTRLHAPMVRDALMSGVSVFCEKPFVLNPAEGEELVQLAQLKGLVSQVGYHNRFVGPFSEVKELLDSKAIGQVTHVLAEAYGPVVLRPKGGTWRSKPNEGGGCLYDYAAHPLNLVHWYLGAPNGVGGTILNSVFSGEIDDEVSSTLFYPDGCSVQLSVNWSDESVRKMTTRITLWGTTGRIYVDRQECQVYLRDNARVPDGYNAGWNTRYTTELTEPVRFYLRGEEYSAQLEAFVGRVADAQVDGTNDFRSAVQTDHCMAMMIEDAKGGPRVVDLERVLDSQTKKRSFAHKIVDRIRGDR